MENGDIALLILNSAVERGQFYAPADLPAGKETSMPIRQRIG
jgi:hypothetical protein